MRRPLSWAGITLVSLTTSWSPGSSHCGSSATMRSSRLPSGRTTSMRAESRGLTGRSAILSAGSSKSNRSVRMAQCAPHVSERHSRGHAKRGHPESDVGSRFRVQPCGCPGMTGLILRRVQRHARLDDPVRVLHRLAALDLVDVLHAFAHLAPHRVLVVEERGVVEADEELAVAGIRAGSARHRGGAADMRLLVEFGLQLLAGTAGAGALRAPGLRHETLDHAVEHDAVVEALAHQFLDPGDVAGCKVRTHLDLDGALGGFEDQSIFCVSHALCSVGLGGSF